MGVAVRFTRGAGTPWVGVTTGPANTFSELEDDPVPDSNMGVAVRVTRGVANEDRAAGGMP